MGARKNILILKEKLLHIEKGANSDNVSKDNINNGGNDDNNVNCPVACAVNIDEPNVKLEFSDFLIRPIYSKVNKILCIIRIEIFFTSQFVFSGFI